MLLKFTKNANGYISITFKGQAAKIQFTTELIQDLNSMFALDAVTEIPKIVLKELNKQFGLTAMDYITCEKEIEDYIKHESNRI